MLGVRYNIGTVAVGDTAELYAGVKLEDVPASQEELAGVRFTVQKPNGDIVGPVEGTIEEDGQGYYQWTDTTEPGEYIGTAQFEINTGEKASVLVSFAINDPFDLTPQSLEEIVMDDVWMRLEDAFDSVDGGPWLRDETRSSFGREKISHYINETLLDINVQQPPTEVGLAEFARPNPDGSQNQLLPLLSKGVLCRVIMHLTRSYVEQPRPQGAQVVWDDRTSYAATWKAVYADEHADYIMMVRLWKRGFLNLGRSALLISSKGGRLYYGASFRARNAGRAFGGGYY